MQEPGESSLFRVKKSDPKLLNAKDPVIKEEILKMIVSYLQDAGYLASSMQLQD